MKTTSERTQNKTRYQLLHIIVSVLIAGCILTATLQAHAGTTVTYYMNDALGSPVVALDEQGNVLWRQQYKPYGEKINNSPTTQTNTRWYTGHPHDEDTGLTYMGARYYDPVIGRFMAIDPQGFKETDPHTFNRYAYGNNNPYKYIDPDGENPKYIFGILARFFRGSADDTSTSGSTRGPRGSVLDKDGVPYPPKSPAQVAGSDKIPEGWGRGEPSVKGPGEGWRWSDPENPGNRVRTQQGDPDAQFPSQREPYVQIRSDGKVIGRGGRTLDSAKNPDAHVSMREWQGWKNWNSPD